MAFKIFDFLDLDTKLSLEHLTSTLKREQKYARDLSNWINRDTSNLSANASNKTITIIKKGMEAQAQRQQMSFVDLKEYFKNSSKVKYKKNGGWYLIIPIQQKASTLKSNAPRSLWNQISSMDYGETGELSDGETNFLEQGLSNQQDNVVNPLSYSWKSSNVTRVAPKSGGKYGHYISFRTVSDKSDPASWIMGRNAFTTDNTNEQQQADIKLYLMKAIKDYQDKTQGGI